MTQITIKPLEASDETRFLTAMNESIHYHRPWIEAPLNAVDFSGYLNRYAQPHNCCFLVLSETDLIGVINLNEIIHGLFKNAFLAYYGVKKHTRTGGMLAGLKLVEDHAKRDLGLHRLEANIQPENKASIGFIQNAGFQKEGYSPKYLFINNEWRDHERWAKILE